jgi:hypothetical protein
MNELPVQVTSAEVWIRLLGLCRVRGVLWLDRDVI